MALLSTTLADELLDALYSLVSATPPDPIEAYAQAFGNYFKEATLNGTPVQESAVDSIAVPALESALVFPDPITNPTAQQGAVAFVAGYTAFWASIVASAPTFWPAAVSVTPPPGLTALSAALVSQFVTNNDPAITTEQAANNLAAAIHVNAGLGGTAIIGVTPFPIL